jgi:hypothetical protein
VRLKLNPLQCLNPNHTLGESNDARSAGAITKETYYIAKETYYIATDIYMYICMYIHTHTHTHIHTHAHAHTHKVKAMMRDRRKLLPDCCLARMQRATEECSCDSPRLSSYCRQMCCCDLAVQVLGHIRDILGTY